MASSKTNGFDLSKELSKHTRYPHYIDRNPGAMKMLDDALKLWEGGQIMTWVAIRNVLVMHAGCEDGLTGQTVRRFVERRWPERYRKLRVAL